MSTLRSIVKPVSFVVFMVLVHNLAVLLYSKYCVSDSIFGVFLSFVNIVTPQCRILLTVQVYTSDAYMCTVFSVCYFIFDLFMKKMN